MQQPVFLSQHSILKKRQKIKKKDFQSAPEPVCVLFRQSSRNNPAGNRFNVVGDIPDVYFISAVIPDNVFGVVVVIPWLPMLPTLIMWRCPDSRGVTPSGNAWCVIL